ncbi:acetyl-CoA C-acyltransferase [Allosaccharopolyspora coralli]|uniref:Probable acetyl-CoA acetyltransferase n=1 Tax=Allosaccharopolyspora coralli TaxID=2665642 RepID=A0A5Q3QHK3_9PSEU|nr:acetyl-CoA C-acetyltransferase [Allosaccharopolyspora coralli]QGK71005.1 acetyl-CoA C-acyltransferase [Allosaccharopolyspora coralli]
MSIDAVIVEPVRTPVGRYGGQFAHLPATDLAAGVIGAVLDRTSVAPEAIDDVVFGQCYPNGEAPAIGRVAGLDAGLPVEVPGLQLDRRCGSGLQAVIDAAMRIQTGVADVVLAGGAESMSRVEFYSDQMRWGVRGGGVELHDRLARARVTAGGRNHPVPAGMLGTAENLRREYDIAREEQDELALQSHRRAVTAIDEGRFDDEIVPVTVPGTRGREGTVVDRDEHPRADTTLESLAGLRPVMGGDDPDATVTAGNASGQNDGAAACLVMSRQRAEDLGLAPYARLVTWAVAGVAPCRMGIGPVPATEQALDRAGLSWAEMDLIELNEAFASQVLACTREWGFGSDDFERLNVNGSGISLGHPVGATGVRILATLAHELRRRQARYAMETMCIGGGQGLAAIFEASA